jgi:hypothetical protein
VIKKVIFTIAVIIVFGVFAVLAHAEPKVSGKLIEIFPDNGEPITRAEFLINKLPLKSDIYLTGEHRGDDDFYKARVQAAPLKINKNFSLGTAAQHVDGTNFPAHQEVGVLVRISGEPIKDSFGKADIRYFPETDLADIYAFLDSKKFFAELYASYNTKTENAMLRPVVDFKIWKNVFVGIEAKFAGEISDLERLYLGLRAGVSF